MVEFLDHLEVGMDLLLRVEAAAVEVNMLQPICFNVVLYVFSSGFGNMKVYTFYVR
jgi:hypothetical protein